MKNKEAIFAVACMLVFVAGAAWLSAQNAPLILPEPVADCIVVKPVPSCTVMEKADFDKANLSAEQRKAAGGKMAPQNKGSGKLVPGDLYYSTTNGDLVKATMAGVWVDSQYDPSNPIVRPK